MCKSMLLENKQWRGTDEFDPANARFYLVVVQYAATFDAGRLRSARRTHELRRRSISAWPTRRTTTGGGLPAQRRDAVRLCGSRAVEISQSSGAPDNSSAKSFSNVTLPSWLRQR